MTTRVFKTVAVIRFCLLYLLVLRADPLLSQILVLDSRGGFDSYHNLATGVGFSEFRNEIESSGRQWRGASSFEADQLAGVDAVLLLQPFSLATALSPSEIAALVQFAGSGGGLLVLGEGGTGSSQTFLNGIAEGFGISFAAGATEAVGQEITGLIDHPLTQGVLSVQVDYQRRLTIDTPALDLTIEGGASDFLAVAGRSVFVSDSSILMNSDAFSNASIESADNRQFARNMIEHLAPVPEPTALAAAILLAISAVAWRCRKFAPSFGTRHHG